MKNLRRRLEELEKRLAVSGDEVLLDLMYRMIHGDAEARAALEARVAVDQGGSGMLNLSEVILAGPADDMEVNHV